MTTVVTRPKTMKTFFIVWIGQIVSLAGSELSSFAIGLWIYNQTGEVTQYALTFLFTVLPRVILTPFSGVIVDRFNRRLVMLFSDAGAGLGTLIIAIVLFTGNINIGIVYFAVAMKSAFSAFQIPAYTAGVTQLVPKEKLSQASGLMQLGRGISLLLAPVLGGSLLSLIALEGVVIVDFVTFLVGVLTLLAVRFPDLEKEDTGETWWQETVGGWSYLTSRPGLVALSFFFVIGNILVGTVQVLAGPLILAFSDEISFGISLSVASIGMLVGGGLMGAWKGPQRLMTAVVGALFLNGLWLILTGLRPSLIWITFFAFLFFCGLAVLNGYTQVILQKKVPLELQGRVFAAVTVLAEAALPISYIAAGPLADAFEPLLMPETALAQGFVGNVIGVGAGRGIGLLFVVVGIITMVVSLLCYAYPRLRLLEEEIPDAV